MQLLIGRVIYGLGIAFAMHAAPAVSGHCTAGGEVVTGHQLCHTRRPDGASMMLCSHWLGESYIRYIIYFLLVGCFKFEQDRLHKSWLLLYMQ